MTVSRAELERFAKKRKWSPERVESIYNQSQHVARRGKGILGDREDISARTTVDGINAVGEVLVLSTGDVDYNGKKVEIDEYVLQALKEDADKHPIDAYVGHQAVHKNKVGQFFDMNIKQCEHDPEKVGLYATYSLPDNSSLDKNLQSSVIEKIKNKEINKLSPAFKITYTTLGDGNKYPTMAKFDEISFIPERGVELHDDNGTTSINNMAPYTDAHIVDFFFGENQFDMYELEETHECVLNISGNTYKFHDATEFVSLADNLEITVTYLEKNIHAADMDGYEKRISLSLEKINNDEYEVEILGNKFYISEMDNRILFNKMPLKVKKIMEDISSLSDKEKSFIVGI